MVSYEDIYVDKMKAKRITNWFHPSFVILVSIVTYLIFALPSIYKPLVADDVVCAREAENIRFGIFQVWHPPLYFDILRFLTHHFGMQREYLRFFGIFCFLATLSLIYFLCKRISLDEKVGLLACFLFASHPWAIQGSLILDIDNTILTVLLTLFIFYFVKNCNVFNLRNYLLSGLLFFVCLWAKLSTPFILLFTVLIFYIFRGKLKEGLIYTFIVGIEGVGLFFLFWAIYSKFYNLNFLSVFERSLSVLGRGLMGCSLSTFKEITLRFIRISLWMGPYLVLLWLIIFIHWIKSCLNNKGIMKVNDFLILYTIIIFVSYIFVGGTSFGFAKHQYPILPILSIIVANFILNFKLRVSKKQLVFCILIGLFFFFIERIYIGDLLYRVNYLLRKTAIFSPQKLNSFFLDFSWRVALYFFVLTFGILLVWFMDRKKPTLKIFITLLLVLILISNFSYNFRHLQKNYFSTYCYGRSIEEYRHLEDLLKKIFLKNKEAIIIGPEDTLYSAGFKDIVSTTPAAAGLKHYIEYRYSYLWNDRESFLRAIEDSRVKCVSYSFTWNALLTYREIFFHPRVKKILEEQYNFFPIGEYSVWLRK